MIGQNDSFGFDLTKQEDASKTSLFKRLRIAGAVEN